MAGYDQRDSTSHPQAAAQAQAIDAGLSDLNGKRVGIVPAHREGLEPAVDAALQRSIAACRDAGAEIVEIDLPHEQYAVPIYYIVATGEASSNLSRYDGVHYGHRCDNPEDLADLYARSRGEGFGPEVKRRIMLGTYVLSAGYFDAYYNKAMQVRRLVCQDYDTAFSQCDVILGPTSPTTAFKRGEKVSDPLTMYLCDIFTIGANLAGTCRPYRFLLVKTMPACPLACTYRPRLLPMNRYWLSVTYWNASWLKELAPASLCLCRMTCLRMT